MLGDELHKHLPLQLPGRHVALVYIGYLPGERFLALGATFRCAAAEIVSADAATGVADRDGEEDCGCGGEQKVRCRMLRSRA